MEGTIKTECAGVYQNTSFDEILDYLHNIAEISNGGNDFATKCGLGLTDETSGLECEDHAKLEEWYYNIFLNS